MKIFFGLLLYIIFTIVFSHQVFAVIFINEFSYQSGSDWVELYNSECEQVSLEGWKIKDSTESQYKSLSGIVPGKNVVSFDLTFLNNSTPDKIRLFTPDNQLTPQSEISIPIPSLTTSSDIQSVGLETDGGSAWKVFDPNTKNQLNSSTPQDVCPTPPPTPTPTPIPVGGSESESFSPKDLIVTEIMPDPEDGKEWVEIYNTTNNPIELSNFQIDDIEGGSKATLIPKEYLNSNEYYVYYTASVFNNGGDSIRILHGDKIIDSYTYSSSTKGVSFALDQSGNWQKTTDSTPGEENSIQLIQTPTPTSQPSPTSKPTPTTKPTPTPKVTKKPTSKVLSAKTATSTSSAVSGKDIATTSQKNSYLPFYLASSAITFSFLGHTLYSANQKKINKRLKKNKIVKKLKSILKIV